VKIDLRCFSHVKYALGRDAVAVELDAGATAGDLAARVREMADGRLAGLPLRVAVNRRFVPDDHVLADGDEAALIPPVQGG